MKKRNICLLALLMLMGCRNDDFSSTDGEGTLHLAVGMESELQVVSTRALAAEEEDELKQNCKVRIYDTDKLIRKYQGAENVPTDLVLPAGDYHVRVTAGDSVAASFEKKFYACDVPFTISKGAVVSVEAVANIANTVVRPSFAESVANMFTDCRVAVSVKAEEGTLAFDADNLEQAGYFSLPSDCDTLFSTFSAKVKATGEAFEHVDTIPFVKSATLYLLTYEYKEVDVTLPDDGGAMLRLVVDATPIGDPIEEEIPYYRRPMLTLAVNGTNSDWETPYYLETEAEAEVTVAVTGSSELSQVLFSSEQLSAFLGTDESAFDLRNLSEEQTHLLLNGGIRILRIEESKGHALEVVLSADLMRKYTAEEGSYRLHFQVTDAHGKMRTADWQLVVSNASAKTEEVVRQEVWATKAVLRASLIEGREPQGTLMFRYRKVDETTALAGTQSLVTRTADDLDWMFVEAQREGLSVWAEVDGLEPGTTYEYQIMEGEVVSGVTVRFATERAEQLPNSGFEGWQGSKPTLIYGAGEEMFWDSGNHGSSSFSLAATDLTTQDASVKAEGIYSAKLQSKNVVIKFAAGNLFAGKYLKTDGTNGVLGWGRPFASRPIALTGYFRYTSGTVDKGGSHIANGEPDKGIVFVALGDWKGEEYGGETWPVVVKTGSADGLFQSDSEEVIAYGEQVWGESTEGEGMHRFTIRIDYRTQRIPTAIIVVASASQFGDYFEGSTGSTMWLDDLKLVYDESELTE